MCAIMCSTGSKPATINFHKLTATGNRLSLYLTATENRTKKSQLTSSEGVFEVFGKVWYLVRIPCNASQQVTKGLTLFTSISRKCNGVMLRYDTTVALSTSLQTYVHKSVDSRGSSRQDRGKPSRRNTCYVWRPPARCYHHHPHPHHRHQHHHQQHGDDVSRGKCCSFPDSRVRPRHRTPDRHLLSAAPKLRQRPRPPSRPPPTPAGRTSNGPLCACGCSWLRRVRFTVVLNSRGVQSGQQAGWFWRSSTLSAVTS